MLNPISNLPILIGHHRHLFTKQGFCGGIKDHLYVCGGVEKDTRHFQMAKHPMQPWLASRNKHRGKIPNNGKKMSLSSAVSSSSLERAVAAARSALQKYRGKTEEERVENEPSCHHLGTDTWQLPFKSECLLGPIGDGSPIPCLVIKDGFENGIHLLLPHYCCE